MTSKTQQNNKIALIPRPPIVVVMGHVNHGKTSLLDYIRKTNVVGKEAGGITQATGAYEVEVKTTERENKKITFIDTPGHEAFSKMRARGANIADIAILVVAADEGMKPQTKEALKILKDTETPYIVAFTKIDKANADLEKVRNELLSEGVMLEGYGGNISNQGVSIKTGEGIEDLLNLVLLLGEVEELTYDVNAPASGFILESHKENQRGIAANFILKDGRLNEGDELATATASGKARILENFLGKRVKKLTSSAPGVVIGFEALPKVGEEFVVGGDKPKLEYKVELAAKEGDKKRDNRVCVILKADTSGSMEALKQLIEPIAKITGSSVGEITSSDVKNAVNTGSIILGFGSRIDKASESLAEIYKVKIFMSDIIYELLKSLEAYLKSGSGPEAVGELEVLRVFDNKGKCQVVGCKVIGGLVRLGATVKIIRSDQTTGEASEVGKGRISNLQSMKKDVKELKSGECGILLDSETPVQIGDRIKAYGNI